MFVYMENGSTPELPEDPEYALDAPVNPPSMDGGDERVLDCIAKLRSGAESQSDPRALGILCQHVVEDTRYKASTRAVFAEILEQIRCALGQN